MSESLHDSQLCNSLSMYEVDSPMGRGAGSFVYKVKNRKTKQFAALKVVGKNSDKPEKIKQRIQNEIDVHSALDHQNIVTLQGHFEDKDNYYLLMELCDGGELYSLVKQKGRLNEEEIKRYGLQLATGLKYLHENKVLHRDLKLSNLLLTDQNILKICDFGLAVQLTDLDAERETICGTPNYISPEIVKQQPYGIKADTWAFGCIMYAMATGSPPFEGVSVKETLAKVQNGGLTLPNDISHNLQNLLRRSICWDPKIRFNIQDILSHPFFHEKMHLPLNKLKSSPLESLCASQNNSLSFGDANSTSQNNEQNRKQEGKNSERALDLPISTEQYASFGRRASSAACIPELQLQSISTQNLKKSVSQTSAATTSSNSDFEEKENRPMNTNETPEESHANMFYRKRQELKRKHRVVSKSIMSLDRPNGPTNPLAMSQNLKTGHLLNGLNGLNQSNGSDPSTLSHREYIKVVDQNIPENLRVSNRNSFIRSSIINDNASSLCGDDTPGLRQYKDRNIQSLNTLGLKPNKFSIKGGFLEVTKDYWIVIELVTSKRKMSISPDGLRIDIEKSTPFRVSKSYDLSTLPTKYIKFYTYASQVCETMKTRVSRVKIDDAEGKFSLTHCKPFPKFEAKFQTGEKVSHTLSSETMRIQLNDGRIYEIDVLNDVSYLGDKISNIVKKTFEKMNLCIQKENQKQSLMV